MTEFKCWRKMSNTKYVNEKREGILYIFDGKTVNIGIDTVKWGGANLRKTSINENFKNHSQALKFANKYMKEHDSC